MTVTYPAPSDRHDTPVPEDLGSRGADTGVVEVPSDKAQHAGVRPAPKALDAGDALRRFTSVGAASLASMAGGMASTKVTAVMVGAPGVGYQSVLVGHAANVALLADLNVTHGMVRRIAGADEEHGRSGLAGSDEPQADPGAAVAASLLITLATSTVMIGFAVLFARSLAPRLLPGHGSPGAVVAFTVAGCLLMLTSQLQAVMSAFGAIRSYRRAIVTQAAIAPGVIWLSLRHGGIETLPKSQVIVAAIGLVGTLGFAIARTRGSVSGVPSFGRVRPEFGRLLGQGALFTIAAVTGTGVANALPLLVAIRLGDAAAGQFRAATVLSAGYLTVLTTALGREFLPRSAGLVGRPRDFNTTVDRQIRLMCALGTPVVLAGIAFSPIAIRVLFTGEFGEAVRILAFQFPGDLLRLISFTLVYALIAAKGGLLTVASELAGGLILLACAFAAVRWFGLPGLGAATSIAYLLYAIVAAALLHRATGFSLSGRSGRLLAASLLSIALPSAVLITVGHSAGVTLAASMLFVALALLAGRFSDRAPEPCRVLATAFESRILGTPTT